MMESRGGTNMQQTDDKSVEELMDEHLRRNGLFRKKIAKDGSCLFRAVAEQVLLCQGLHAKVRAECVKYLKKNRERYESFIEGDFEEHLLRLQDPQSWVGQVEISALSVLYKHDFIIYQQPGEEPVNITENGFTDKVLLCFLNGNHYDSVYPVTHAENAAMCQSILYELLYNRVCSVKEKRLSPSLFESKPKDEFVEVIQRESSEESDLDEGDDFWSGLSTGRPAGVNRTSYRGRGRGQARGGGRGSLLHKVKYSLSPVHFRNVEYDVWLRSLKAQQRRDFCMAAGMHYQTGDKCQVRLNNTGRFYSAHIQDVGPSDGPVTVFIEELGKKQTVPLWSLRTSSEDSWSAVNETSKRRSSSTSNIHTDERETKPGRKAASHLEQQHSWPPQDSKELQSLRKNANRRADQDARVVCMSPTVKEEHDLLELLHKDEENFPTLGASVQAACSEGSKRAEKKGAKKKADTEIKGQSPKNVPKAEKAKQVGTEDQDQRTPSSLKEEPNSSPPATLPAASSSKVTKAVPASTPAPSHTTPVPSKTATVSTQIPHTKPQTARPSSTGLAVSSQTVPDQSAKTPVSPTPTAVRPETIPVTSAATPVSSQNSPVQSQTALRCNPVSVPSLPPERTRTPHSQKSATPAPVTAQLITTPVPCQTTLPPLVASQTAPAVPKTSLVHPEPSAGLPQPAPVTTPAAAPSSAQSPNITFTMPAASKTPPKDVSAYVSADLSCSPGVPTPAQMPASHVPFQQESNTYPPYPPLYTTHAPSSSSLPPFNMMPTPQLLPPPSAPTPPYCPTVPRPFEPGASPVPGPAGASVPGYLSQHPFPLAQICQDPLYPGIPKNDHGEIVQPPPFSSDHTGKDLPSDTSVLRFFFNLGVKAFMYSAYPPITYLMPLTQAYQMQLKTSVSWQPENNPRPDFPAPSSSPRNTPMGQFGIRGVAPAPPVVEAFSHHAVPGQMPLPVTGSFPNVYAGMYLAPPAGHPIQYPPPATSVGHQQLPLPPPPEHGGLNVTMATMMGGSQTSAGGVILAGFAPDIQRSDGILNKGPVLTWLANGNRPDTGGASLGTPSLLNEWESERAEFTGVDLTRGQSYFNQSNRSARHGQEYRGNKGRGSRGRRDYPGRDRQDGHQTPYPRGSRGGGRVYTQYSNSRAGYTEVQFTPTANS